MFSFSENTSCTIVAGGSGFSGCIQTVEVILGDRSSKHLTNLPEGINDPSIVLHYGAILLCGGRPNVQKCLLLDHGTWKEHSTLNQKRRYHSAVTTKTATFLFGGEFSRSTYEYLPKDSTTWLIGKTEIPGGFWDGCAIAVKSDQEIWLIGGWSTDKRILSFNVNDHTFKVLPFQLDIERCGHKCASIPNTSKVMIAGGNSNSTQIIDTENGTVTMVSPLNSNRSFHGMGVLTIKGEDRLVVFGGSNATMLDSVETYNYQTEKWETSDIELNEPKDSFGFLTVKLSDIIPELQFINN